jgi:hypothetical protein
MAAINFPNSPSDGDTHEGFVYNSTLGVWKSTASSGGITVQDEGSALATSASTINFVGSNVVASGTGSTKTVTLSGGGAGESPIVYTEPPTSHTLNTDGSTSTVQMQAVDPEGTAITYGIAYANSTNARPDQLAADTTIDQSTGTYTFDPSTNTAHDGTFKARLSASDGITHATRFVDFDLAFTFSNLLTTSMVFDHYNAAGSATRFPNAAYGMTYNHLDATLSTSQFGAHNQTVPSYLAVYIGTEAKAVNQIKFNIHSNHFGDFELQGSNDANTSGTFYNTGTWTALTWASGTIGTTALTSQNAGGRLNGFADHTIVTNNYTNSVAYTHYRVVITNAYNYSSGSGTGGWASYGWEMNRV